MYISTASYDHRVYTTMMEKYPEETSAAIQLAEKVFTRLNGGDSNFVLHFIWENEPERESDNEMGVLVRTQFAPGFPNPCSLVFKTEKVKVGQLGW